MKNFIEEIKTAFKEGGFGAVGKLIGDMLWEGIKKAWNVGWPVVKGVISSAFTDLGDSTAGSFLKTLGAITAVGGMGPLAKIGKGMKSLVTGPVKLLGLANTKLKKTFGFGKVFDDNAKRWRKMSTGQFAKAPKGAMIFKKVMDNKFVKGVKNVGKGFKAVGSPAAKFFKSFGKIGKAVPVLGQALTIMDGIS